MNEQEREMDLLIADLEQENRLLRARNERLEKCDLSDVYLEELAEKFVTNCYSDTLKYARAIIARMKE